MELERRPFSFMLRRLLTAGIPLSGVYVADLAVEATDTAMVGRLGPDAIAGVGLGGLILFVYMMFCMALPGMTGVLISERAARQDKDGAAQAVQHGIWVSLLFTIPGIMLLFGIGPFLRLTGQQPEIVALAERYSWVLGTAIFPWMAFSVLDYFVTALNRPKVAFSLAWVGVGLNALGNYVLIYGHFGLPALGVAGAALASGLTAWTTFAILGIIVHRDRDFGQYPIFGRLHPFSPSICLEIIRTGAPGGVAGATDMIFASLIAVLLGRFSVDLLAASQIALSFNQLIYAFISGLGFALTVFVAELNGGNRQFEIRSAWLATQVIALAFLGAVALLSIIAPGLIIRVYLDIGDPANAVATHWAGITLAIVAITRMLRAALSISWRALSGLKDTLFPSMVTISATWGLGLPVGYVLATRTELGGLGFVLAEAIGTGVAAIFVGRRLWRRTAAATG